MTLRAGSKQQILTPWVNYPIDPNWTEEQARESFEGADLDEDITEGAYNYTCENGRHEFKTWAGWYYYSAVDKCWYHELETNTEGNYE